MWTWVKSSQEDKFQIFREKEINEGLTLEKVAIIRLFPEEVQRK